MFAIPVKRPAGPPVVARKPAPTPAHSRASALPDIALSLASVPLHAGSVGGAGAGQEREADKVADRLSNLPFDRIAMASPPPLAPLPAAGTGPAPAAVRDLIGAPGQPLAGPLRRGFEAGFGRDFASVRIHADARADAAAASLDALAFTFGRDIAFRAGRFAPATTAGRILLAHELAHVVQQQGAAPRLQLKGDPAAKETTGSVLPIRVYITGPLRQSQLLIEIIKQHLGAADDLEALRIVGDEFSGSVKWGLTTEKIDEDAIARGYVWVRLDHPLILKQQAHRKGYFQDFPEFEQTEFDLLAAKEAAGDERKTDSLLEPAARDELVRQRRLATRDELVRQHQEFAAQPKLVRDFLIRKAAPPIAGPVDTQAALRVAAKIGTLSEAELKEFGHGHPVAPADWATFEWSIDLFLAERDQRIMDEAARRQSVEGDLNALGAELIDRYYAYQDMPAVVPWGGLVIPNEAKGKEGPALDKAIVAAGLPGGLDGLEQMIGEYEEAFARDAARLIRVQLDRQLHELMVQEKRYLSTDDAERLGEAVGKSDAAADYDEARKNEVLFYVMPGPLNDFAFRAALAEGSGRDKVLKAAADDHPLIMQPDFDLKGLAQAAKGEVLPLILKDIAERREAVANFKDKLEDSEFIFRNGEIFERSLFAQGIAPGSMFDRMLRERREREETEEMLEGLVLVVAGIAAAAMTGGLGWVAVVGEVATAVLDANALYRTLSDYQEGSDAYRIGWSSTEPSAVDLAISIGADMIPWDKLVDGLLTTKVLKGSQHVEPQLTPGTFDLIDGTGQVGGGRTLEISRGGEFINTSGEPGKQIGGGSGISKGSKRGTGSKKPSNQKQFYNQKPLKKSKRTSSADIKEMFKKQRPKAKKTAGPEMKTAAKAVGPETPPKHAAAMLRTAEETSVVKDALIQIWSEAFASSVDALDLTGQHSREERALAAVREAGEIIAKAMQLGLSVDDALTFVDLRRSGVSAEEVEKTMTIMAMMDVEEMEIAPLDSSTTESDGQPVPPKK